MAVSRCSRASLRLHLLSSSCSAARALPAVAARRAAVLVPPLLLRPPTPVMLAWCCVGYSEAGGCALLGAGRVGVAAGAALQQMHILKGMFTH